MLAWLGNVGVFSGLYSWHAEVTLAWLGNVGMVREDVGSQVG